LSRPQVISLRDDAKVASLGQRGGAKNAEESYVADEAQSSVIVGAGDARLILPINFVCEKKSS
jgi:hypothetical protein